MCVNIHVYVCVCESVSVCVYVCVCLRERKKERDPDINYDNPANFCILLKRKCRYLMLHVVENCPGLALAGVINWLELI